MSNPICHWELMVSDVAKANRFYESIFDWKFAETPGYTNIDPGGAPPGGLMAKPPMAPMPALNVYFQVDDIARTMRAAVEAGATPIVPKTEIPGMGWFAMFLDPDRIPVGIVERKLSLP